jgi:hypothetical protein
MMCRNLAQSLYDAWLFDFLLCLRYEVFTKNVSAFAENISVVFFGGHGDSRDSPTSFTALLASNLIGTVFPPNDHSNYRF